MEISTETDANESHLSDDPLIDEEWTIINKEINSPRALSRLYAEERQRSQCMSPETDHDEDCTSPCLDTMLTTSTEQRENKEFQRILELGFEEESEDELILLKNENAELRLVVAQLRSYISALQSDKRPRSLSVPPTIMEATSVTQLPPAEATEEGQQERDDDPATHSLRQDLLRMFSKKYRSNKRKKID